MGDNISKFSEQIETFLNFLRDCDMKYHMAEADEQEANNETQDILHSLELEDHDYREFAKLSKELKVIRKKRRKAKNVIEITTPLLKWAEEHKAEIKSLERLLGEMRRTERKIENRVYVPRERQNK